MTSLFCLSVCRFAISSSPFHPLQENEGAKQEGASCHFLSVCMSHCNLHLCTVAVARKTVRLEAPTSNLYPCRYQNIKTFLSLSLCPTQLSLSLPPPLSPLLPPSLPTLSLPLLPLSLPPLSLSSVPVHLSPSFSTPLLLCDFSVPHPLPPAGAHPHFSLFFLPRNYSPLWTQFKKRLFCFLSFFTYKCDKR